MYSLKQLLKISDFMDVIFVPWIRHGDIRVESSMDDRDPAETKPCLFVSLLIKN